MKLYSTTPPSILKSSLIKKKIPLYLKPLTLISFQKGNIKKNTHIDYSILT